MIKVVDVQVVCLGLCIILFPLAVYGEILPAERIMPWDLAGTKIDFDTRVQQTPCLTLSPNGTSNDSTQIQNAIATCAGTVASPQVVKLNPGTYNIGTMITWGSNNYISLVGSGTTQTILATTAANTCPTSGESADAVIRFSQVPSFGYIRDGSTNIAVSVTIAKGDTSLTTSVAHGLVAGDYALLSSLADTTSPPNWTDGGMTFGDGENGTRFKEQVVRVVSTPTSTTLTFTPPAYWTYDSTRTVQVNKANTPVIGVSVESLAIQNVAKKCRGHLVMSQVFNSRFYDLDLTGMPATTGAHWVYMRGSAENTFKHMYIHSSDMFNTDGSYGFFIGPQTSNTLIEDNIVYRTPLFIAPQGSATGNVISYNYGHDAQWSDQSVGRFGNAEHGGASGNLWEGNELEGSAWCDGGIGNFNPVPSHYNAHFRNHILRNPRVFHNATTSHTLASAGDILQLVDMERLCHLWSFVGNVFTDDTYTSTRWQHVVDPNYDGSTADCQTLNNSIFQVWKLGYNDAFSLGCSGTGNSAPDAQTVVTLIRYGNYTPVTEGGTPSTTGPAGVTWDTRNIQSDDRAFVNSYYLSAKPAFFGSCTWPWIVPTASTQAGRILNLPAKERFLGLSTCSGSPDTTPPAAPTGVTIQ